MKNILLLSDTHSYIDDRILDYVSEADEVWHSGDFGNQEVIDKIKNIKLLRGVFGNIDDANIRSQFPEVLSFFCENVGVLITHIGGSPSKYTPKIQQKIKENAPKLFISGHSHILKAVYDKKYSLLYLNPGACGNVGWHKVRTMMRFKIHDTEIKDLEIIELGKTLKKVLKKFG